MKKTLLIKKAIFILSFFSFLLITIIACKKKSEEEPKQPFTLRQEALDQATISYQTNITGDPFNAFSDAQKFGSTDPAIQTKKRDLFSNGEAGTSIAPGTIIVRKAFDKNTGVLINAAIMVKQEEGFNAGTNDWEFINIKYDATVDYQLHPNGLLPDISKTDVRGVTLTNCINCHKIVTAANWVFTTR